MKSKLITRQIEATRNRRWSILNLILKIKIKFGKKFIDRQLFDLYQQDINPRIHYPKIRSKKNEK